MTWTTIPDAAFSSGKPARALDMRNLRDNIAAAFNGDLGAPKLDPEAITDGTIPAGKLVANSITADQIGPGAVDSSEIATGAIDNSHIATATIGAEKFQSPASTERDWVADCLGLMPISQVNGPPVILCQPASTTTVLISGTNYAGSGLRYGLPGVGGTDTAAPGGTWQCLISVSSGSFSSSYSVRRASYFRRVA